MKNQELVKPPANNAKQENDLLNVILITLDAFNYELFIENIEALPNMKQLKSESVFFENTFSIGATTFFSFPGIIGSVYPYHFGIGIDENIKATDEVLKGYGYNTAQINECCALLTPFFGYSRNTDYQEHLIKLSHVKADRKLAGTFLERKDAKKTKGDPKHVYLLKRLYDKLEGTSIGKLERYLLQLLNFFRLYLTKNTESFQERQKLHSTFRGEILEFINRRFEGPQFLWIHTIVNHLPYFPPESSDEFSTSTLNYLNYRGLTGFVNRKVCRKLKRLYVESMKTTDRLIGDILDNLRANSLLDSSMIVITADHGEEFMEDGYFGHAEESSSDRLLHVPLIVYCPKLLKPNNISAPVSTIDILPTICALIDHPIPNTCRGASLKEIMLYTPGNSDWDQWFWRRPIFSEAWKTEGLLDRNPGHISRKKIFTVRKGKYKLKVIQEQISNNTIREKFELTNWTNREKLDIESNNHILQELRHSLHEHIFLEAAFARRILTRAKEQRKIRGISGKLRAKK